MAFLPHIRMRFVQSATTNWLRLRHYLFGAPPVVVTQAFTPSIADTSLFIPNSSMTLSAETPHILHHDYTWLTKESAKSHTMLEICRHFKCTEQGAKAAMHRRGITHCKDAEFRGNAWHTTVTASRKSASTREGEFEVDSIVGKRSLQNGKTEYLVQWKGLGDEQCTWEPAENMTHCKASMNKYEQEHHGQYEYEAPQVA